MSANLDRIWSDIWPDFVNLRGPNRPELAEFGQILDSRRKVEQFRSSPDSPAATFRDSLVGVYEATDITSAEQLRERGMHASAASVRRFICGCWASWPGIGPGQDKFTEPGCGTQDRSPTRWRAAPNSGAKLLSRAAQ